jgi:hypothetical protein
MNFNYIEQIKKECATIVQGRLHCFIINNQLNIDVDCNTGWPRMNGRRLSRIENGKVIFV